MRTRPGRTCWPWTPKKGFAAIRYLSDDPPAALRLAQRRGEARSARDTKVVAGLIEKPRISRSAEGEEASKAPTPLAPAAINQPRRGVREIPDSPEVRAWPASAWSVGVIGGAARLCVVIACVRSGRLRSWSGLALQAHGRCWRVALPAGLPWQVRADRGCGGAVQPIIGINKK